MSLILTAWLYLLLSPIVALIIVKKTKNKSNTKKCIILSLIYLSAITILSVVTEISTTNSLANCILACTNYLTISLVPIHFYQKKQLVIKLISGLFMAVIFGIGYITSTIGFLGLAFIVGEFETACVVALQDNLVLKQYNLGNAVSDSRDIKIDLFKRYNWLPLIERRIVSRRYGISDWSYTKNSFQAYKLNVAYDKNKQLLLLSDSIRTDTIRLK